MDASQIDVWFAQEHQSQIVSRLIKRVGLTRIRAECFVRLWIYLLVKLQRAQQPGIQPPLQQLDLPTEPVICTLREAAELFYTDKEYGSDRAAGMMLDKLAALGLIKKHFDGNATSITIQPTPEILVNTTSQGLVELTLDDFDPRCDAIPIANLLATNYNWMNRNQEALPHRITQLLRIWAEQYAGGMRVLRRCDNLNPVGFYLLYPTAKESEPHFFGSPNQGLHLSKLTDVDPFKMALPNDAECVSIFIRSWVIDPVYLEKYRLVFLQDAQLTLRQMQKVFPNLCDLYTLIIHPGYEELASALGFQKTSCQTQLSVYWMYLALDRFLGLDIEKAVSRLSTTQSKISW